MTINAFGPIGNTGLGNAFSMHTEALSAFVDVNTYKFNEQPDDPNLSCYFHGNPTLSSCVELAGRNIAFLVCESSELTNHYLQSVDKFDSIWTSSTYCVEVLERCLNRNVDLVPHCVKRLCYSPMKYAMPKVLISFDGHSRFTRKNPLTAIRAVKAAFGGCCELMIKARNLKPSLERWLRKECEGLNYTIINKALSAEELDELYKSAEIYLALHRSEGFGLQILEAMSYGTKVVTTGFSGNMDFTNELNSYLVDYKMVPVNDQFFLGEWAEPNFDSAVEQLKLAAAEDFTKNHLAFSSATYYSMANTINYTLAAL